MKVKLQNKDFDYELGKAVKAARVCYNSENLSDGLGDKDMNLLHKLAKLEHHTPFEQITITWVVGGVSRALLQELARHRMQSINVQSTRYTINKMVDTYKDEDYYKYFVRVSDGIDTINRIYVKNAITMVKEMVAERKVPNDELKFMFPEALKCNLITTMNLRGFANFYSLRSSKAAMWEIRELANEMFDSLPADVQDLILDMI